ncbi:hypothetical protein [Spiroplasma endosymbiont of Nebria brevicollis]|uniref:hypothetical protein n=1 Tax=Spiroplasma endosymbiont of Nebria brevicollis TaxID=3066284 RepID=UPI00313CB880
MPKIMFKFKGHWINKVHILYVEMISDNVTFYFTNEVTQQLSLAATEAELKALDATLVKVGI